MCIPTPRWPSTPGKPVRQRLDLTLYAYGADGKLVKVAPELWSITDETGAAATEATDGVLYELRVTVADGGDFDLSETEKEIQAVRCAWKISGF